MRSRTIRSVILFLFVLLLSACTTTQQDRIRVTPIPTESELESPPVAEVVDYVDVLSNPSEYNGRYISVAGQISAFKGRSNNNFYFYDRLGNSNGNQEFLVYVDSTAYKASYNESLCVGDYVIVEGTWKFSNNSYSDNHLAFAIVVDTGAEAKTTVTDQLSKWAEEKECFAQTLPVLDYFSVLENRNFYDNQYIRIVGQISSPGVTPPSNHFYFHFDGAEKNDDITISLDGCPQEMQKLCSKGEYAVVTGVVSVSKYGIRLDDCYVECVGNEAKELFDSTVTRNSLQPTPEPSQEVSTQEVMVWVSETGLKYHSKSNCSNMRNPVQIPISNAQSRGLDPCQKCF